jgi:hypothetical protein
MTPTEERSGGSDANEPSLQQDFFIAFFPPIFSVLFEFNGH